LPVVRLATLLATLLCAAPARADDQTGAREAYQEGIRYYDLGEYKDALDAFKRAYVKYEAVELMYNIAQCHRLLGNRDDAVRFYRLYLAGSPSANDRAKVEALIGELERPAPPRPAPPPARGTAHDDLKEPASASEAMARAKAARAEAARAQERAEREAARAAEMARAEAARAEALKRETSPPTPLYRRWWLWTVVAVVAVGAGVGIALGVASAGGGFQPTLPDLVLGLTLGGR
jgi:tetratricopeptide (TPR) repeat protein